MPWKAKTLGISSEMESKLREIKDDLEFSKEDETYKFCFAIALAHGLKPRPDSGSEKRETKWAINSFDESREIETLLDAMYCEEGNDIQQVLVEVAEAGIERVHQMVKENYVFSVSEVLSLLED